MHCINGQFTLQPRLSFTHTHTIGGGACKAIACPSCSRTQVGVTGDLTVNPGINGRPDLPPEPHPPDLLFVNIDFKKNQAFKLVLITERYKSLLLQSEHKRALSCLDHWLPNITR